MLNAYNNDSVKSPSETSLNLLISEYGKLKLNGLFRDHPTAWAKSDSARVGVLVLCWRFRFFVQKSEFFRISYLQYTIINHNSLTQNSHTYPISHNLFALTRIWLFTYGENFGRNSLNFFQHWLTKGPLSSTSPSVQHISSTQKGHSFSASKIPQFHTWNPSVQYTPSVPYQKPLSSTPLSSTPGFFGVELRGFWCGTEGF